MRAADEAGELDNLRPDDAAGDSVVGICFLDGKQYFVKSQGRMRSADDDERYLGLSCPVGYHPNHPAIEWIAYRIGIGRANLAEVLWPVKDQNSGIPPQWRSPGYYLSRDASSYAPGELPQQIALDAEAAHFVFNILLRNWDACVLNRRIVRDLPVLFDFGEALNPALFEIEAFVEAISRPHAMGHYCDTYRYAAAFRPPLKERLARALEIFYDMDSEPVDLADDADLPAALRTPILHYLQGAPQRLQHDVEYVLAAI